MAYQYTIEALLRRPITERDDSLYEQAKDMYHHVFCIVCPDAENLPERLLGEVVEVQDMFFPEDSTEPLFEVSGFSGAVPMSALRCI